MVAYNFKAQFAEAVAAGEKRQTLRRPRRRQTRPGDHLEMYTGMRTKQCRLLRNTFCGKVTPVVVGAYYVEVDGKHLLYRHALRLARADGFAMLKSFYEFFDRLYGLPVELELIEW